MALTQPSEKAKFYIKLDSVYFSAAIVPPRNKHQARRPLIAW